VAPAGPGEFWKQCDAIPSRLAIRRTGRGIPVSGETVSWCSARTRPGLPQRRRQGVAVGIASAAWSALALDEVMG